ncbi:kinase-like domain-containing protein [Paraphoma chrysanthemicola]|nr:kinase-like domain-containing protein [Paraphoma chrysanthemicola]
MAPNYDLYYQPKDLIPNIVCRQIDYENQSVSELSEDEKETLKGVVSGYTPGDNPQLCRACGWSYKHELCSSYLPRLRVQHAQENKGLWTMGNDWMVWDRAEEDSGNDFMTHQFLQMQGAKNIPLVKRMVEFKDENGRYNFTVMSRIKGITLDSIWNRLSRKSKHSYAQQLVVILRELRQFTADFPQRVDGSPLWDNVVGNCNSRKQCIKVGRTKEEWFQNMDVELREGISRQLNTKDETVIDARLQELETNFPDGAPYVLTHADLNLGNIMVTQGRIEAIIDWELAGYYPWWVEMYTSHARSFNYNSSRDLWTIVWNQLGLSMDDIRDKVGPVMRAFERCPVEHTGETHIWQRPPFCKCQPYGGDIRKNQIDIEGDHVVRHDRPW